MDNETIICSSDAEFKKLCQDLKNDGWFIIPCDEPKRGLRGFIAEKDQMCKFIQFAIFGHILTPENKRISGDEYLKDVIFKNYSYLCDDVINRCFGLLQYNKDTQTSIWKYCDIKELKKLSKEQIEELNELKSTSCKCGI